jgi:hypothetical protein
LSNKKRIFCWSQCTNFLVLTLISVTCIYYFYLSAQNEIVGLMADDAVYLLMADYFSPYYSSLSQNAAFIMETSQFPPLYPILLAVLGANSENVFLAHIITTCCLVSAVVAYYFWIRETQISKTTSLFLALIFICSPASLLMNVDLWSEHFYLFLTMCALLFIEKANTNYKFWLIASILIGLMPLARLVGLTFVVAFFIYLQIHKIKYRYRYIAISIIPFLIWKVVSLSLFTTEIYEETLMNFYQYDFWLHTKHLFFSQLPDLWTGWHECFDIRKNFFSGIVCACILIMSLVTWFLRLLDKRIDSIYVLFYLLLILIWPDPNHNMRFLFVIFPILLYYSYVSLSLVLKFHALQNLKIIINYASILIVVATFLPTDLYAINRSFAKLPDELESYRASRYLLTVKYSVEAEDTVKILKKTILSYIEASQHIPDGQCVYTAHQENFMFHGRRLAFSLPLPKEVMNNSIFQYLDKCKYVHVLYTNSHPEFPGGYPIDRLENNFDYLISTQMSEDTNSQVVGSLLKLY